MPLVTKAAILAAGKGTRMRGLCEDHPKPLLPVANVPLLEVTIERLKTAGVSDLLIVVGHRAEQIEDYFGDGERLGVNISYVLQSDPKGTGEAALLCEDFAGGERFMLVFGDILAAAGNYPRCAEFAGEPGVDGVLSVWLTPDTSRGASVFVEDGRVTRIVEKPPPGSERSNWDNAGFFVFPPDIFDAIRCVGLSERGEYELTGAIQLLLERGKNIRALVLDEFWFNMTDPETMIEMNRCLLLERRAAGLPMVSESAVTDGFSIIDPLALVGERCRLGKARIGHNVTLCDDVVVEDGADLRSCIVLPGARIGFANVVNAVIPNGFRVDDGRHVIGRTALAGIDDRQETV